MKILMAFALHTRSCLRGVRRYPHTHLIEQSTLLACAYDYAANWMEEEEPKPRVSKGSKEKADPVLKGEMPIGPEVSGS